MANEGIMALPQGGGTGTGGRGAQPVYVSSADTYDAALTALSSSTNDPSQAEAVRQVIRDSIEGLDLSPTQLDALLEVLEYMSQNPDQYSQIRQRLIDSKMMESDDLPEVYDPVYLGIAIMAINEAMIMRANGAMEPMQMSPRMQGIEGMPEATGFKDGGLADVAKYLAAQGRNGDSILAHITPSEARLLKSMGGAGTINPKTGLPEYFLSKLWKGIKSVVGKILKNPIVKVVATIALATVLGPAAASVVGAATGATAAGVALSSSAAAAATALASTAATAGLSALSGESITAKSLLVNAAASYFGAGGTVGGVNPASAITTAVGKYVPGGVGGATAGAIGTGATAAGIGVLAGMKPEEALRSGIQSGLMTGAGKALSNYRARQQAARAQGQPAAPSTQAAQAPSEQAAPSQNIARQTMPETGATAAGQTLGGSAPITPGQAVAAGAAPQPSLGSFSLDVGNVAPTVAMAAPSTLQPNLGRFSLGMGDVTQAAPAPAALQPNLSRFSLDMGTTPAGSTAAPTGFIGRVGNLVRSPSLGAFKDAFLVNPNAKPGTLMRYAPGVATALAATYATGGFEAPPAEESPLYDRLYTGEQYILDNPELFASQITPYKPGDTPYNPLVPTPRYAAPPESSRIGIVSPPPLYTPTTGAITNNPSGVYQPYNVSGLYGIPSLYSGSQRVPGYAAGGAAVKKAFSNPVSVAQTEALLFAGPQAAQQAALSVNQLSNEGIMRAQGLRTGGAPKKFPRKTGPINGPGTGTSDSIPAMLSDGEFVFTAKAVRNAGNGSRRKGARRMYKLMKMLEGGKVKA